jgi:hypothetical protein
MLVLGLRAGCGAVSGATPAFANDVYVIMSFIGYGTVAARVREGESEMAITARDVEQLHEYAEGVMGRAGHVHIQCNWVNAWCWVGNFCSYPNIR